MQKPLQATWVLVSLSSAPICDHKGGLGQGPAFRLPSHLSARVGCGAARIPPSPGLPLLPSLSSFPSRQESPEALPPLDIKEKYYTGAPAREEIMRTEEKLFIQVVNI